MKITNDKNLNGCIVLERGTHFLSKQIIMHMRILALMTGKKHLPYSHAEFLLWNPKNEQLYTIGARKSGTEISTVEEYYKEHEIIILKPKEEVNKFQTQKAWIYFLRVDPSKYQSTNFLSWITYLKTLIYISKKGDKKTYCYELAARFANSIGRWKGNLDKVSIYDLYENPYYTVME